MLYYPLTSKGVFKGAIVLENHEVVQLELEENKIEEIRPYYEFWKHIFYKSARWTDYMTL